MGKDGNDDDQGKEKKERPKKSLILKTLERCRTSIAGQRRQQQQQLLLPREGWLSVLVGPQAAGKEGERERFVIRTECLNRPLFRMLLEEAEMEFGYANSGPLVLPCDVEVFCEVMREMEAEAEEEEAMGWCNFAGRGGSGGYRQLNQALDG